MKLKELDEIDRGIVEMLQKDPELTHNEIAKKLDRSQPAIGARIKSLTENGILGNQYGIDFNRMKDVKLVIVELTTNHPQKGLELAQRSPYVINILKISGTANLIIFMACSSLKRLDYVVDKFFRHSEYITNIRMELVTNVARPFVLPFNFQVEDFETYDDPLPVELEPEKGQDNSNKLKKLAKTTPSES